MAETKDNTNKIASLKKYIESIERQLNSPPPKYNKRREAYEAWACLEIKRTLSDIEKLKV